MALKKNLSDTSKEVLTQIGTQAAGTLLARGVEEVGKMAYNRFSGPSPEQLLVNQMLANPALGGGSAPPPS